MRQDMISETPIKVILKFCVTIVIGNLFQQLYNMVDSIIVGKLLGLEALAAVGSTGSLNFLVLGFVIGICSGFGVPMAHFVGARDEMNLKKCISNSVYLSIFISIVLTSLTVIGTHSMLRIMRTPETIYYDAYQYIVIIFAGLGAVMFYNLLTSISRAMGDVRTPLIFLLVASVLNVILDYILVKFTPLATAGAAYATVISQIISAILCLFYMYNKYPILHIEKELWKVDTYVIKRLLGVGIPMALQYSITAVGTIIVQIAVNSLGAIVVAGVTAASRIQGVITQPLEALGLTLTTYCGQNYGAGRIDRIKKGISHSVGVMILFSLIMWAIVFFFGEDLTSLFIKGQNKELIRVTQQFMNINGMFFGILGLLLIIRNAIQGLGYAGSAIFAGVFETVGRLVVALILVGKWGYMAICYANPIAWLLADILLIGMLIRVLKTIDKKMIKNA